ncbi:MAG: Uncharacterized DrsE/F-like sulphur relay protein SSO3086, partial [uncultured Solirubrobacterales bacterium]
EGGLRLLHLRPHRQLQARADDPAPARGRLARRRGRRNVLLRRQHLPAAGRRPAGRAPGQGRPRAGDAAHALRPVRDLARPRRGRTEGRDAGRHRGGCAGRVLPRSLRRSRRQPARPRDHAV